MHFQIGNAYIDYVDQISGLYDYFWSHALLSDENHDAIVKYCNFSSSTTSEKCEKALYAAPADWGNVLFYNIYAPFCGSNSTAAPVYIHIYMIQYTSLYH